MSFALPISHKCQTHHSSVKADTVKKAAKIISGPTIGLNKLKRKHKTGFKPLSIVRSRDNDCTFDDKFTLAQRLRIYPFSKAVEILAISYPLGARDDVYGDDTLKYGLHIKDDILDHTSLLEVKELDTLQINELTNIIFNTEERNVNKAIMMGPYCFNPRNALIFYDKNGKMFDYLEICFECQQYYSMSDKLTIGTICNQKFDLVKQFFIDAGVKYGTVDTHFIQ